MITDNIKYFFISFLVFISNVITFQVIFEIGARVNTSSYLFEFIVKSFFLFLTAYIDYHYWKEFLNDRST